LRKALVVSEVTLALVCLCGAGLLIRTLWKLNSVNPGSILTTFWLRSWCCQKQSIATPDSKRSSSSNWSSVSSVAGIESVGGTSNLPLSGTNMVFLASVEGRSLPASFRAVSHDYFRTMRIPLLKGRWFDGHDTAESQPVVVINERWPAKSHLITKGCWVNASSMDSRTRSAEVVGVIGDVKYAGLDQQTKPEMYAPFAQRAWPFHADCCAIQI
jgi:hypothetical protein